MFKVRLMFHILPYGLSALIVILSDQLNFAGYVIQILISLFLTIYLEFSLEENKKLKAKLKEYEQAENF